MKYKELNEYATNNVVKRALSAAQKTLSKMTKQQILEFLKQEREKIDAMS